MNIVAVGPTQMHGAWRLTQIDTARIAVISDSALEVIIEGVIHSDIITHLLGAIVALRRPSAAVAAITAAASATGPRA